MSKKLTRLNARAEGEGVFPGDDGGVPKRMHSSFYRGETINYNPYRDDFASPTFLEDYLLKGWLPEGPLLSRKSKVTAFGSCFAAHITTHLGALGYDLSRERDRDIYISRMGEGLVNTYALLGQFEWALEDRKQPENLWHGFKAEGYGYDEAIRVRTRDVFLETDFFIITLGLSEIWYDEVTDGVFWRAVPMESFDPARHRFRVSSVGENKANIAEMHRLIRKHVPAARVLFTLSPIRLAATFRPVSCLTADSASKAILRAGLDEFLRSKPDELNKTLFYFPAYEILQHAFVSPWRDDGRHPQDYVLDTIMKTFEAVYCENGATLKDANRRLQSARAENLRDVAGLAGEAISAGDASGEPPAVNGHDERRRAKEDRRARKMARRAARSGEIEEQEAS